MWRGEWEWEAYDHDKEWDSRWRRRCNERNTSLIGLGALGGSLPQEVLLGMVHMIVQLEFVSTCLLSMPLSHTELFR